MQLSHRVFGKIPEGRSVDQYTIQNGNGITIQIITYGATLSSVKTPNAHDRSEEITLGFDALEGYLGAHPYFGATIGRYANRIGKGTFVLDGKEYALFCNEGPSHLHGGKRGFDRALWDASPFSRPDRAGVRLAYVSPDGEEGYPGTLDARVTYTLDEQDVLEIDYEATTDKPTPVNLTNHAYWNLRGAGSGDIRGHRVTIYAEQYLPVDVDLIPTGELAKVEGTKFDLRSETAIGGEIESSGGYDHCFAIRKRGTGLQKAARVYEPGSGRGLEVRTTQPGIQFYTGNMLTGIQGRGGKRFAKHSAFCLETEDFPDAVNQPKFPSTILRPGERYHQRTTFRFFCQ